MFQDAASAAAKEFLSVAGTMDDYPFGLVSDDAVFAEYEVKGEFWKLDVAHFKKIQFRNIMYGTRIVFSASA